MFTVALKRCASYERARVASAVASAIDLLGGMSDFVRPGARVLVKPNLLYPRAADSAVTTHPEVVRAVVELARLAGAGEIMVGDSPGLASARTAIRASGLEQALAGTGAQPVEFDEAVEVKGGAYPKLVLARRAIDADVVLNVAKAKTHVYTGLTMCTKNCFGFVPGLRKSQWHLRTGRDEGLFGRLVVDIARTVGPALNVLDAVVAMEGNGPGSGTPRSVGAVLAGRSAVAVDMVAARMLGFRREELPVERAAVEMSAGPADRDDIELLGEDVASLAVRDFARPPRRTVRFPVRLPHAVVRLLERFATPRPELDEGLCTRCGQCAEICPAGAIAFRSGARPALDRSRCVSCFCCQEICPSGAISVRSGLLAGLFGG